MQQMTEDSKTIAALAGDARRIWERERAGTIRTRSSTESVEAYPEAEHAPGPLGGGSEGC